MHGSSLADQHNDRYDNWPSLSAQRKHGVNSLVLSVSVASATNAASSAAGVACGRGADAAPTTLTCRPNIILRLHLAYVMRGSIVYVDGGPGTQHIASPT